MWMELVMGLIQGLCFCAQPVSEVNNLAAAEQAALIAEAQQSQRSKQAHYLARSDKPVFVF